MGVPRRTYREETRDIPRTEASIVRTEICGIVTVVCFGQNVSPAVNYLKSTTLFSEQPLKNFPFKLLRPKKRNLFFLPEKQRVS